MKENGKWTGVGASYDDCKKIYQNLGKGSCFVSPAAKEKCADSHGVYFKIKRPIEETRLKESKITHWRISSRMPLWLNASLIILTAGLFFLSCWLIRENYWVQPQKEKEAAFVASQKQKAAHIISTYVGTGKELSLIHI